MEEIIGAAAVPVDAAAIERELEALWTAANGQLVERLGPGEEETVTTRASARNLLVPCSEAAATEARAVVAELVNSHPARVIFLLLEPDAGPGGTPAPTSLTASVSAFCHRLGSERRQVCCEWIELRARGGAVEHLPAAVLALLEADVPVALWWPGKTPVHAPLWERLAPMADCWILDSAATPDLMVARRIAALLARAEGGESLRGAIHDLAWTRLMPWRELTAQFFDPRAFRPFLMEIDRIEVWAAPGPFSTTTPYLWIAWMAQRLGWQAIGNDDAPPSPGGGPSDASLLRFTRPGGEARARVLPATGSDLAPGEMGGVRLAVSASSTSFTVQYDPGATCATLTVSTPGACPLPRTVSLRQPRIAPLLATALDAPRGDSLYAAALDLATRLVPRGAPREGSRR